MNNPKVFAVRKTEADHFKQVRKNLDNVRTSGRREGFAMGVVFCVVIFVVVRFLLVSYSVGV
jgi:hypothetical protein